MSTKYILSRNFTQDEYAEFPSLTAIPITKELVDKITEVREIIKTSSFIRQVIFDYDFCLFDANDKNIDWGEIAYCGEEESIRGEFDSDAKIQSIEDLDEEYSEDSHMSVDRYTYMEIVVHSSGFYAQSVGKFGGNVLTSDSIPFDQLKEVEKNLTRVS
jgi:hypothetical protein